MILWFEKQYLRGWQVTRTSIYLLCVSSSVKSGSYQHDQLSTHRSHLCQRAPCDWQLKGLDHSTDSVKAVITLTGWRGIKKNKTKHTHYKEKAARELQHLTKNTKQTCSGQRKISANVKNERASDWKIMMPLKKKKSCIQYLGICAFLNMLWWGGATYPVWVSLMPPTSWVYFLIRWNHSFSSRLLILPLQLLDPVHAATQTRAHAGKCRHTRTATQMEKK